ncbi:MAG TPA: globin domain-containing protein [Burkholderiaceae bacterium]|nr:globin domain-containing protein [Burkholderiaceae bacterium]
MNEHTIALVRESFDLVEPIAPQAAEQYFAHLYAIDPPLQRVLGPDMPARAVRLMPLLATAIAHLDESDALMPTLRQLGRHLAERGVQPAHYESFRAALLKTLYESLGVAYTEDVEAAWIDVYGVVAQTMQRAATAIA